MKKLNVKGFTLIELLAIISILAIILLIAVPAISNVIENANKNAFKNSVLSIVDSAEDAVDLQAFGASVEDSYDDTPMTYVTGTNGNYYIIKVEDMEFKNKKGWEGYIVVEEDATDRDSYIFITDGKRFINGNSKDSLTTEFITTGTVADLPISTIEAAVTSKDADGFTVSGDKLSVQ